MTENTTKDANGMRQRTRSEVAVITGASSGIGRALALELARRQYDVGLIARRSEELGVLADAVRDLGVRAEFFSADVSHREEVHNAIRNFTVLLGPVDLLVANAGIGLGTNALEPDSTSFESEFRVNVFGAFYAIEAVIPLMRKRQSGHVVAISSLASYRGLPGAAGYCASKAALTRLVEGFRPDWARVGIDATIVHPGYVRSEMTDKNDFHMPLLMDADQAARRIARAIQKRRKVFEFPRRTAFLVRYLVRWLPDRLLTIGRTYKQQS